MRIMFLIVLLFPLALARAEVAAQVTENRLPAWMKPFYNHGLLVTLDDNDQVIALITSRIMNDNLLARLKSLPRLRELHIEVTQGITPAGLANLGELRTLEKLTLYEVNAEGPRSAMSRFTASLACRSCTTCRSANAGQRMPAQAIGSTVAIDRVSMYQERSSDRRGLGVNRQDSRLTLQPSGVLRLFPWCFLCWCFRR